MQGPFTKVQRNVMVTTELYLRFRLLNRRSIPLNQKRPYHEQQRKFKLIIPRKIDLKTFMTPVQV